MWKGAEFHEASKFQFRSMLDESLPISPHVGYLMPNYEPFRLHRVVVVVEVPSFCSKLTFETQN